MIGRRAAAGIREVWVLRDLSGLSHHTHTAKDFQLPSHLLLDGLVVLAWWRRTSGSSRPFHPQLPKQHGMNKLFIQFWVLLALAIGRAFSKVIWNQEPLLNKLSESTELSFHPPRTGSRTTKPTLNHQGSGLQIITFCISQCLVLASCGVSQRLLTCACPCPSQKKKNSLKWLVVFSGN